MNCVGLVWSAFFPPYPPTSPTPRRAPHMDSQCALVLANTLAWVAGCAPAILPVTPSSATRIEVPPRTDSLASTPAQPVTIEVRYYAHSPTVTIVGWDATESAYGLRAWLRRDGSLIIGHRLYVSTYYTAATPAFTRAATPTRPLQLTGISHDVYSCVGGPPCSPPETFGAFIPDAVLRSDRDSLAVTFYDRANPKLPITIHRNVIDAYLGVLDSVVAVMRRKS